MVEKVYLQWNFPNWITVAFMAFSMMLIAGMIASAVRHYNGSASMPATE